MRRLRLDNPRHEPLVVWLEPLGDRIEIPAGRMVDIHLWKDQTEDLVQVTIDRNDIKVHAWIDSVHLVEDRGRTVQIWPGRASEDAPRVA